MGLPGVISPPKTSGLIWAPTYRPVDFQPANQVYASKIQMKGIHSCFGSIWRLEVHKSKPDQGNGNHLGLNPKKLQKMPSRTKIQPGG